MKKGTTVRAPAKHAAPGQDGCSHYQAVQAVPPKPAKQQPLAYPPDVQSLAELSYISPYEKIPELGGITASTSGVKNDQTQPYQCNSYFLEMVTREDFKWHFEIKHGREESKF